jgi:hypothetical protein
MTEFCPVAKAGMQQARMHTTAQTIMIERFKVVSFQAETVQRVNHTTQNKRSTEHE